MNSLYSSGDLREKKSPASGAGREGVPFRSRGSPSEKPGRGAEAVNFQHAKGTSKKKKGKRGSLKPDTRQPSERTAYD